MSFGDLRELLHDEPNAQTWSMIVMMLDRAMATRPDDVLHRWLPYARAQLRHWDRDPRTSPRLAPRRWIDQALLGEPCPCLTLAARVEVLSLPAGGRATEIAPDLLHIPAWRWGKACLRPGDLSSMLAHRPAWRHVDITPPPGADIGALLALETLESLVVRDCDFSTYPRVRQKTSLRTLSAVRCTNTQALRRALPRSCVIDERARYQW